MLKKIYWLIAALVAIVAVFSGAGWAFSINDEIKLGKEASKEVEKEMPPVRNEAWQRDINAMGQRFMPYIKRKQIPYSFKVVDAKDEINAFALPGGFVYFTARMWNLMTPDERAGIMAHEITHCDQRHGVNQMLKSEQRMLWMLPILIATAGSASPVAMVASVGNMAITQRYSRDMEKEADQMGMDLLVKSGFSPGGLVTSMKKLLNLESNSNRYEVSEIFASHPDTMKRIAYLTAAAISNGAKPEDLELKKVDDPSRLGNITNTGVASNVVFAQVKVPLEREQMVTIKKMLWDDDAGALRPRRICKAVVIAPGKFPILSLRTDRDQNTAEIMPGDGVYPDEPDLAPPSIDPNNATPPDQHAK